MNFSFPKSEKLKSKKIIELLFEKGKAITIGDIRMIYTNTELPLSVPLQAAFAVPKKKFKNASDRNLLKRRMREAYRLHKNDVCSLLKLNQQQMALIFVYRGSQKLNFKQIENKIHQCLLRLDIQSNPK